jgi:uncharacterized protein
MLRGPQTLGELKQRTERLHHFDSLAEIAETLDGLGARELVTRLERRPGQKEERWAQLLGGETEEQEPDPSGQTPGVDDRLGQFEARLEHLEQAFEELRARLDA